MGCSISCSLFEQLASFLHWMVAHKTNKMTLDHYLDDFIFVGPSYSQDCKILMDAFFQVCKDLGVLIAEEKNMWAYNLIFLLGLVIDTNDLTVKIPIEKVRQFQAVFFFHWPVHWHGCPIMRDITLLELIPVVLAISTWGSQFSNKRLIMHMDNEALVSVINKQTSKSKNVMTLVRNLVLCLLQNNTTFCSEHVPGSSNKIADSISRKQWSRFRILAPDADEFPTKIPKPFAEMIFNLKLTDC